MTYSATAEMIYKNEEAYVNVICGCQSVSYSNDASPKTTLSFQTFDTFGTDSKQKEWFELYAKKAGIKGQPCKQQTSFFEGLAHSKRMWYSLKKKVKLFILWVSLEYDFYRFKGIFLFPLWDCHS